jgi:hypothetical protein
MLMGRVQKDRGLVVDALNVDLLVRGLPRHKPGHHDPIAASGDSGSTERPCAGICRLAIALDAPYQSFAQFNLGVVNRAGDFAPVVCGDKFDPKL